MLRSKGTLKGGRQKKTQLARAGGAEDINGCITDHIGMSGSPGTGCLRINCASTGIPGLPAKSCSFCTVSLSQ